LIIFVISFTWIIKAKMLRRPIESTGYYRTLPKTLLKLPIRPLDAYDRRNLTERLAELVNSLQYRQSGNGQGLGVGGSGR
jgi:hypothetical protein